MGLVHGLRTFEMHQKLRQDAQRKIGVLRVSFAGFYVVVGYTHPAKAHPIQPRGRLSRGGGGGWILGLSWQGMGERAQQNAFRRGAERSSNCSAERFRFPFL